MIVIVDDEIFTFAKVKSIVACAKRLFKTFGRIVVLIRPTEEGNGAIGCSPTCRPTHGYLFFTVFLPALLAKKQ